MDQTAEIEPATLPEIRVTAPAAPPDTPPRGPASTPPAASALDKILSPGSTLGRYLAQSGMSAESALLANQMGEVKDRASGTTLSDCLRQHVTQAAYDGRATLCTPDKAAALSEVAGSAASRATSLVKGTAGRVLGQVFDTVVSGLEVQTNHKDAIRTLAQNNYPGMAYQENVIGNIKVTVWADAVGAGLYPDDPKMKIYDTVESLNGAPEDASAFSRDEYKKVEQLKAQTSNTALESAQNYIGENGYEAFRKRLDDAPAIMEKEYQKEQQAVMEYRKSIQPGPQDRPGFDPMNGLKI